MSDPQAVKFTSSGFRHELFGCRKTASWQHASGTKGGQSTVRGNAVCTQEKRYPTTAPMHPRKVSDIINRRDAAVAFAQQTTPLAPWRSRWSQRSTSTTQRIRVGLELVDVIPSRPTPALRDRRAMGPVPIVPFERAPASADRPGSLPSSWSTQGTAYAASPRPQNQLESPTLPPSAFAFGYGDEISPLPPVVTTYIMCVLVKSASIAYVLLSAQRSPVSTSSTQLPAVEESSTKPQRQPRYHVLLWDDDKHTFRYVIRMMRDLFGHSLERMQVLAEEVDTRGSAICLTTTLEHAELKRDQIHAYGRDDGVHDCQGAMSCSIEPER